MFVEVCIWTNQLKLEIMRFHLIVMSTKEYIKIDNFKGIKSVH